MSNSLRLLFTFLACWIAYRLWRSKRRPKRNQGSNRMGSLPAKSNRFKQRARRIFISHSWKLGSYDYQRLVSKLRNEGLVYNHSIPKRKARPYLSVEELRNTFRKQLLWCSKVFVLAHKDLAPDGFVAMELEVANELNKEIIAIRPVAHQPVPSFIQRHATKIIDNNMTALVRAIQN